MSNNSLKCIASWLCLSNVLDSIFNSKSICVNFKNIFLTKFIVKFNILFQRFWIKKFPSFRYNPRIFCCHILRNKIIYRLAIYLQLQLYFSSSYSSFSSLFFGSKKKRTLQSHGIYMDFWVILFSLFSVKIQSSNLNFLGEKLIFLDETKFVRQPPICTII